MDKFKKLTEDFQKGLEASFAREEVQALFKSIKESTTDLGTFRVKITNEAIDRAGEMIKADGWDFGPYMKSPVVLWGHDYKGLPIGMTLRLVQEGAETIAEGVFAPTEFAQECRKLYDMGMLRASSVGFIPKEMEGNIITKAELLEWSFVAVPCNAEALSMLTASPFMSGKDAKEYAEGLVTKGIMTAEVVEAEEEKGAVADEVAADAQCDLKCDYLESVWDILNAFFDLVWAEETTVEQLPTLLSETADLLKQVADGSYVDPEEGADMAEGDKTVKGSIVKVGKTAADELLSDIKDHKTVKTETVNDIQLALGSIKTLSVALEGLLSKATVERNADVEQTADTTEAKNYLYMRSIVQGIATVVTDGLAEARKRALDGKYY